MLWAATQRGIDAWERRILSIVALTTTSVGALGGALLSWQLWGDAKAQGSFWSLLLTVSALTALPLFAATTHLGRMWVSTNSSTVLKTVYVLAIVAAATATLVEVVLCLYQTAITPSGGGDPNDLVLLLTTVPAGATVGAAMFGVAATVLDKIDT